MESLHKKLKLILYKNNDFDAFFFSSISYSLTATFFFSLFSIPMISKSKIEFLSREAKFDEFTEFQETLNQRNRRKFETVNNYTTLSATSFPKYLSPRPFDKKK